ncbi:unnamed protein product [Didymodactylos carnosus]|uniref:G-protein coupled receptors family 1 profile domain-containing protein n=1 Tax=Didymodactylos carnosus TaxID=1234261 RepID=A0A8S2G0J9_9BILA|nr:unnamed protein product [Didymodactylos carnosus]CAF4407025.1 unnamed protein product [Didymodactylos carnosus]
MYFQASFHQSVRTKQKRVTKMVVIVTLVFAICWLPIQTLELLNCTKSPLLRTFSYRHPKLLNRIRIVSHALSYFNSCLNPYLYALLNRNFCADAINVILKLCQCIPSINNSLSTTSCKQRIMENVISRHTHELHKGPRIENDIVHQEMVNLKDSYNAGYQIEIMMEEPTVNVSDHLSANNTNNL